MKTYFTAQDVAGRLRVSVWTIYSLVREGTIPAIRLRPGGKLLFDPEAVEAAIRSQAAPSASPPAAVAI
jgi:excisionase family DNA binding protein